METSEGTLSRSSLEAYIGIAISIFSVALPMSWLLCFVLFVVVAALAVDICLRAKWFSSWSNRSRQFFALASAILVLSLGSYRSYTLYPAKEIETQIHETESFGNASAAKPISEQNYAPKQEMPISKEDAIDVLGKLPKIYDLLNKIKNNDIKNIESDIANYSGKLSANLFVFLDSKEKLNQITLKDYQSKLLSRYSIDENMVAKMAGDIDLYVVAKDRPGPAKLWPRPEKIAPDYFSFRHAIEDDVNKITESIDRSLRELKEEKEKMEAIASR